MIARTDLVFVRCTADGRTLLGPTSREQGARWVGAYAPHAEAWELILVASCQCCGSLDVVVRAGVQHRCERHRDRNPCLVDGCRRTIAAGRNELADDQSICGAHWRRYVPPGSPLRRTYNRFFRLARRHGWTPGLIRRFERFWTGMAARVRRQAAEGFVDQREIDRLFGWSEAA